MSDAPPLTPAEQAIARAIARILVADRARHPEPVAAPPEPAPLPLLLTARDLKPLCGIPFHRVTLWAMVRKGTFPAPVRLGPRRIAWRRADVLAWIAARAAEPPCV